MDVIESSDDSPWLDEVIDGDFVDRGSIFGSASSRDLDGFLVGFHPARRLHTSVTDGLGERIGGVGERGIGAGRETIFFCCASGGSRTQISFLNPYSRGRSLSPAAAIWRGVQGYLRTKSVAPIFRATWTFSLWRPVRAGSAAEKRRSAQAHLSMVSPRKHESGAVVSRPPETNGLPLRCILKACAWFSPSLERRHRDNAPSSSTRATHEGQHPRLAIPISTMVQSSLATVCPVAPSEHPAVPSRAPSV